MVRRSSGRREGRPYGSRESEPIIRSKTYKDDGFSTSDKETLICLLIAALYISVMFLILYL